MQVETTFHLTASGRIADVDDWTRRIGIIPSGVARKGDKAGSAPAIDSWWAYVLERTDISANEQLLELLGVLLDRKDAICALAQSERLEVSVTSYVWDSVQGLAVDLDPAAVRGLSLLNCSYAVVAYE